MIAIMLLPVAAGEAADFAGSSLSSGRGTAIIEGCGRSRNRRAEQGSMGRVDDPSDMGGPERGSTDGKILANRSVRRPGDAGWPDGRVRPGPAGHRPRESGGQRRRRGSPRIGDGDRDGPGRDRRRPWPDVRRTRRSTRVVRPRSEVPGLRGDVPGRPAPALFGPRPRGPVPVRDRLDPDAAAAAAAVQPRTAQSHNYYPDHADQPAPQCQRAASAPAHCTPSRGAAMAGEHGATAGSRARRRPGGDAPEGRQIAAVAVVSATSPLPSR